MANMNGYILNRLMSSKIDICWPNGDVITQVDKATSDGSLVPSSLNINLEGITLLFINAPNGPATITPIGMSEAIKTRITAQFIVLAPVDSGGNIKNEIAYSKHLDVEYTNENLWRVNLCPVFNYYLSRPNGFGESTTNIVVIDDEP